MTRRDLVVTCVLVVAACSPVAGLPSRATSPGSSPAAHGGMASPSPQPQYPPYYIESLRQRAFPGGHIEIGDRLFRGAGFTKFDITWPSQGQTMTGTISLPDGPGPFPVVIVNHGFIPTTRFWVGQDSGIFGDPMASHGFISIAPNYPGYAGSGKLDPAYPSIVATTVPDLDLISSVPSLPQADPRRLAMMGHSNGGGVSLLVSVIDPRVKAFALFAPISSDMADNARKWWTQASRGELPSPDDAPNVYSHLSPRNYFSASNAPTLFLQGNADQDIPAAWTDATIQALHAKGVQADAVWYPGGRHDLVGADLANADARAEAWIRQALG